MSDAIKWILAVLFLLVAEFCGWRFGMRMISCDPGINGAFVTWGEDGTTLVPIRSDLMPMNGGFVDVQGLRVILEGCDLIVLEKVGGLMGQSPSRAFNFGRQVGTIYATALECGCKVIEVPPQTWQKVSHYALPKKLAPKDRSRAAVERLYPKFSTVQKGCRVSHDGVCDALLIGHWYRMHKGEMDI